MSTKTTCPHCSQESDTPDFCSSCGLAIDAAQAPAVDSAAAAQANPSAPTSGVGDACPKCSTSRSDPTSPFCEVCGYNFVTQQGGDVSTLNPATNATPAAPAPNAVPSPTPAPNGPRLDLTVAVDGSVSGAPTRPERNFSLFEDESLIGRQTVGVRQTVPIEDSAVSKRHALIVRNADGTYIIRDLASSNGTTVNGQRLGAGVDSPIKQGDVIKVGEFTVITVAAIRQS